MPYLARITRGAALRERRLPYVEALEVQGFSAVRISARHLVPNLLPLIVAQASVSFGYVMIDLAGLSYLGLGVGPTADWGVMISAGQQALLGGHPQQSLYAGAMIVIAVCAFTLFGERLIDPDR